MSQSQLLTWLAEGRVLLGDGAMGTMLQQAGLTDGGAPELWNVTAPEKVQAIYQAYIDAGMAYIRQSEFQPEAELPAGIAQYTRYENCLECGLCVSACPIMGSSADYYGPAALAAAWRVVAEPRGQNPQVILDWVDNESGCWRCHVAYECTEVCPSEVDPGGAIMSLRRKLTGRKFRRLLRLPDA